MPGVTQLGCMGNDARVRAGHLLNERWITMAAAYKSMAIKVDKQDDEIGRLEQLRERRAQLEQEEQEAVLAARIGFVPDNVIAQALGVVRGTVLYRYGPRRDAEAYRGKRVTQDTRVIVTVVPTPRAATS